MTLAIYSLHHQPIGKSTQQRPHTAAAHIRYISRFGALSHLDGARMPLHPNSAAEYLVERENADRSNARVIDKIRLALPIELDARQRAGLVRGFAEELTQGRAPWLAAFHDRGEDRHNPHCHLVVRDRDVETGRRVIGTSEAGSTDRIRALWEMHTNQALEQAGRSERVDRRTLAAQGIDREPTIHEGPKAQAMDRRGAPARSKPRTLRNGRGARRRSRWVDYPAIDKGRSRPGYNRSIVPKDSAAECWAAVDRAKLRDEFKALGHGEDYGQHAEGLSSMQGIKPTPVGGVHAGNGVSRLGQLDIVGLDSRGPFFTGALPFLFPVAVKRPVNEGPEGVVEHSDRIVAPESPDKRTNMFNGLRKAEDDISNIGLKDRHTGSIDTVNNKYKGDIMQADDLADELNNREYALAKHVYDQSRARYDNLMERSYLHPKAAEKRMDTYRAKHGDDALYDKLKGNARKTAFGRRPGSILSPDALEPGAGDRRTQSQIARRELPDAAKDYFRNKGLFEAAERARKPAESQPQPQSQQHSAAPKRAQPETPHQRSEVGKSAELNEHRGTARPGQPPPASAPRRQEPDWARMPVDERQAKQHKLLETEHPPSGQGAPSSFSERQQKAREASPEAQKSQRDRDLERMKKSREQEKEQGR